MTAAPAIKGWCPTLLSPMQSGDGWLARVKPSAGVLSAEAARLIADAARRHGNGHIDLTSRAQICRSGASAPARRENLPRPSSAQASPTPTRRWKPSATSWRARSGPTMLQLPSTLKLSLATSKPCSPRSPSFGRCRRNSVSLSMAAARCRLPTSLPTSWSDAGEGALAVHLDGGTRRCALRSVLGRRNGEGSGARFPSPVRAAE